MRVRTTCRLTVVHPGGSSAKQRLSVLTDVPGGSHEAAPVGDRHGDGCCQHVGTVF